jgi:hypothetical protein
LNVAEGLVDVQETTTKASSVCQSFGSYFVEDATNCGAYYLCQNGKQTKMTCPEKQLFDLETSLCADFQTVFCGMRPVNYADKNQCEAWASPPIDRMNEMMQNHGASKNKI